MRGWNFFIYPQPSCTTSRVAIQSFSGFAKFSYLKLFSNKHEGMLHISSRMMNYPQ
jgi:hypothetical protein